MWLLDTDSLELKEFGDELPSYSILSHTWGHEEVTFKDLQHGWLTNPGSRKLRATCKQSSLDGYRWTWIDTCCIDRTSHDALQEAIRSMYKWYAQAAACYVHLADVRSIGSIDTGNDSEFRRSRWFTRSWTLQELIAPRNVIFFTASWKKIGTKHTLQHLIANITGIPPTCLSGESQPREFSVVTRFSWASKRECRKREDVAYSLMGLFDVYMPILYGEYDKAFFRLQEHIFRQTADQSMLAWSVSKDDYRYGNRSCIFATSPVDFTGAPERRLDAIGSPSLLIMVQTMSMPFRSY
ncbi:heterokaryon incompatibility protein-domain-containing protein [Xylariaceae sp. FL1019]|nr:heterokaryon incompatibility protein-domain-containing protein [Xylariaceae sp. FL1019]